MRICLIAAASFVLAFGTHAVRAELYAYEGFDYGVGEDLLTGAGSPENGGVGFSSAWNMPAASGQAGQAVIADDSLFYSSGGTSLLTNGNHLQLNTSAAGFDGLTRSLPLTPTTSELWIGFTVRLDGSGSPSTFNIGFSDITMMDAQARGFQFQYSTSALRYRLIRISPTTTPPAQNTGVAPANGRVDFVAARVQYTTGNDTVSLFINPSLTSTPTAAQATFSLALNGIGEIKISANQNADTFWSVDEIRLDSSFADVAPVPEPAGWLFCVGGAIGLLGKRRRR